ncbi:MULTISPECIES: penicillin-binding protein 1A [Zobellia]|uniref:Penicillin-binding protein 1B, family GT51 n=1 Tax=Zobellia galactanivorans (strain DSM 12802 / CCUG 47099 / CIP 106680 / NCIMB 13871 / Dsij) TaxID=63186 RepID=G0L1H3_ZOBGA|nr:MULTISPECIES: transglycosylase domain-containing protein [Zobellia]MBU3026876.1 transglycosylase domain-containing protein [Zobellia galactanivorans]OWW23877.1 penicillin-binding protein [Zobellia sp. OII3]CAZ94690.1 Penicillin-binding protein 1B, family GT51 [Zobellia galactanivorans]
MVLKRIKSPFLRYTLLATLALVLFFFVFILSIYWGAWGSIPNKEELSDFQYQRASEVYTADSVLIGKFYLYDRQPIAFEAIPEHLRNALVSIEDERFYDHSGIDYQSLGRVAVKTILMQDQSAGGGSTLTQQLAKNLYPRRDRKKTNIVVDKIKEMVIASRLEDIYTKEEILTHYLNTVSFGDNTFGIESASLKFFNKQAKDLNVEEGAVLVGMLKATYGYNPRIFPERSLERRNLVLQAMANNHHLSNEEKDSLTDKPLKLDYRDFDNNAGLAPYFREEVRKQLLKWNAKQKEEGHDYNIYTSGLKVYTTLDYNMQFWAEEAMREHMQSLQGRFEKSYGKNAPWRTNKKLIEKVVKQSGIYQKLKKQGLEHGQIIDSLSKKKQMVLTDWDGEKTVQASSIDSITHYMKFLNTGSLALDPKTGAVKTWIGGIDFEHFKFDHVAQSKRQVGSTFKPIVYTTALETGILPCTYFSAEEVAYENLKGWSPSNSGKKDETYLNYSMEEALSHSVNTVAVKVLEKAGISNVLTMAKNMGIFSKLPEQPSLALGTGEIYLNELAGAYASYVNDGKAVLPYLIEKITDKKDSVLMEFKPKRARKTAFSEETRQIMIEMMKGTIDRGTASRIRSTYKLNNAIAGKTGTTQNNKDAWFVAITPKLVHVTWVGLDHHEIGFKSTSLGQGANAALPIFAKWMQEMNKHPYYNEITKAQFERPNPAILEMLDCEPVKRDGFFKRLFKNPDKKKTKKFRKGN